MSIVSLLDWSRFERWLIEHYPKLFEEWEVTASEYADLDDWLFREHGDVLSEWNRERRKEQVQP